MTDFAKYEPPKKITLNNGLRIIMEGIPSALSCTVSLWVDGGVIDENESVNGVSHFIEHIVFKGTHKRTALQIAEESENVGANLNAFTDKEHTCYHAMVLGEYLPTVVELFLDMLFNSKIENNDFELERQVILEEIKMYEDTPEDLVQDILHETMWKGHPLGKPITGTIKSISSFKRETLLEHLANLYTPDNMVISIAGKFDFTETMNQIESIISNNTSKRNKNAPPLLEITPGVYIEHRDIEQAHLSFATKGTSVFEQDRYTLAVIDIALGGGMSSRLFQEIREKRGLAYAVSSYYQTNKLGGLFGVYAGTTGKDSSQVMEIILKELNEVKSNGFSKSELERAKMQLRTSMFLELESTKVRSFRNALNELYYQKFFTTDETNESIQAITNEDVIRLSNEIFNPKYFTLAVVGPREELPTSYRTTF